MKEQAVHGKIVRDLSREALTNVHTKALKYLDASYKQMNIHIRIYTYIFTMTNDIYILYKILYEYVYMYL